jgi:hypothetical protein
MTSYESKLKDKKASGWRHTKTSPEKHGDQLLTPGRGPMDGFKSPTETYFGIKVTRSWNKIKNNVGFLVHLFITCFDMIQDKHYLFPVF